MFSNFGLAGKSASDLAKAFIETKKQARQEAVIQEFSARAQNEKEEDLFETWAVLLNLAVRYADVRREDRNKFLNILAGIDLSRLSQYEQECQTKLINSIGFASITPDIIAGLAKLFPASGKTENTNSLLALIAKGSVSQPAAVDWAVEQICSILGRAASMSNQAKLVLKAISENNLRQEADAAILYSKFAEKLGQDPQGVLNMANAHLFKRRFSGFDPLDLLVDGVKHAPEKSRELAEEMLVAGDVPPHRIPDMMKVAGWDVTTVSITRAATLMDRADRADPAVSKHISDMFKRACSAKTEEGLRMMANLLKRDKKLPEDTAKMLLSAFCDAAQEHPGLVFLHGCQLLREPQKLGAAGQNRLRGCVIDLLRNEDPEVRQQIEYVQAQLAASSWGLASGDLLLAGLKAVQKLG